MIFSFCYLELDTFIAIANSKYRPESPPQLAPVLEHLSDLERRKAAIDLVSLDNEGDDAFTLGVLEHFDELHGLSQPKVMDATIISPQFQRPAVQESLPRRHSV